MKKKVLKKILQYVVILLLVGALSAAVVWADLQRGGRKCKGVRIDIVNADSASFVTKQGIIRELKDTGMFPVGRMLMNIDTETIERRLEQSEFMENVECYIDDYDVFVVEASQLVPVMRVFDGNDSYYVNRSGKRMSALGRYHVDVPVVEGHFSGNFKPVALLPIIDYVAQDDALSSLVTMYVVRDSCNICFVPSVVGHIVNLGDGKDCESKFAKLLLFYKEVLPVKGWNTYSEISLKWDHQVVATLRSKGMQQNEEYNPEEDDQAPDLASIQMDEIKSEIGAKPGENEKVDNKKTQ